MRLVALPSLINFFVIIYFSRGPASSYGWRYFVFTAIPVLMIPFARFISKLLLKKKYIALSSLLLYSIIPLFGMIAFLFFPIPLTLSFDNQFLTYRNPTYFWDLIIFIINSPVLFFSNIVLFHIEEFTLIVKSYPTINFIYVLKNLIVYLFPLMFIPLEKLFQSKYV